MIALLAAPGPAPEHAEEMALFGQFVGSWDIDMAFHPADGPSRRVAAEWHFGWILEGRGVQDVLVFPPVAERPGGEPAEGIGTTVRLYDPELGTWRVVWLPADRTAVVSLTGRAHGDGIRIEGRNRHGHALRWCFQDIGPDRFSWRGWIAREGDDWRLEQEMEASRRVSRFERS